MEDCLVATYDCCSSDAAALCIARRERDKVRVLNIIHGDEAVQTYNKLVGNVKECCKTCKHCERLNCYCCMHPNHAGDYVPPYTVCGDYKRK